MLATIANSRTDNLMAAAHGNRAELPHALTEGFQAAFLTGAGFAALGFVLALVMIKGRDSKAYQQQEQRSGEQAAQARAWFCILPGGPPFRRVPGTRPALA